MTDLLARVRRLLGPDAEADHGLLAELVRTPDLAVARKAGSLVAGVPDALLVDRASRPLRVAVATSFTCDVLPSTLTIALLHAGIRAELHVTAADELMLELTDPESDLARFVPQITLCALDSSMFLPHGGDVTDPSEVRALVSYRKDALAAAVRSFAERVGGTVLLHTVPLPWTRFRSVIAYRSRAMLGRIWRELNIGLLNLSEEIDAVHVMDWESMLVEHPGPVRDERLFQYARMAWTPSVERLYAGEAARFCRAVSGLSAKCLVLDLDNTLWGGVLADDGPEGIEVGTLYPGNAFLETQRVALALRRQGVLLAIASKSDPELVDRLFEEHPGLVLRGDDFAARAVDWQPKDGNLRALADELNIGLDSMVFADDSRFECELVTRSLPAVTVVHLAGDPAGHAARLLDEGRFDVLTTTETDEQRTALYLARGQRERLRARYPNSSGDYLRDLGLCVTVRPADAFALPRVHQLELRTNQFTLLGPGGAAAARDAVARPRDEWILAVEVADRFGTEGMVGAVWLAREDGQLLIENFVLSCRVLSRGIEFAVLQAVADRALAASLTRVEAAFRATSRNGPARRFLDEAGFVSTTSAPPEAALPEPGPSCVDDAGAYFVLDLAPPPAMCPEWIALTSEEDRWPPPSRA